MPLTPDPLSEEERAVLVERLAQAEEALHNLLMGGHARVIVDSNGERVEYTAGNATRLRSYIYEIKLRLGVRTAQGPMKMWMV